MSDSQSAPNQPPSPDALLAEVAELRRQNEALRRGAAEPTLDSRLAAIVESSDDAIVSKTLEGIIRTWNKGAERIFGWKSEEVVGKAINLIIPPDRQDEEPQILARMRRGDRVDHFETVRMTKDGRLIDVSVTISPIRDASGEVVGASKVARDVTLQKRFQRELEKAKDEAEQANRAKDQFLSVLSHELRTPLTPVLAEMSYLEQAADVPESIRANIAMIRRNVETEARLVDDLLDLTRITRGKLRLQLELVDLNEALRAVVAMVQSQIDEKQIELTVGLRARSHQVWGDAGRIQQVFLNLLSNAAKFTPEGGRIAIRTTNDEKGDAIRVEVTDSGVGIGPELLPRLFNAFEQAEEGRREGGLGLGLSIARSLVELHRGTISASSQGRERGATFIVELATTLKQQPDAGAPESAPHPPERASGFRVLLVEDHADTRRTMARLLEMIGCTVKSAGTVHEAIAMADQGEFDLLISDIGLPDGSGTDVMRRLRGRKVRGIALSGFGQEEDMRRSREAGFDDHITKPINFQFLRDAIRRYASEKQHLPHGR